MPLVGLSMETAAARYRALRRPRICSSNSSTRNSALRNPGFEGPIAGAGKDPNSIEVAISVDGRGRCTIEIDATVAHNNRK
jgi:hypothetical protein